MEKDKCALHQVFDQQANVGMKIPESEGLLAISEPDRLQVGTSS